MYVPLVYERFNRGWGLVQKHRFYYYENYFDNRQAFFTLSKKIDTVNLNSYYLFLIGLFKIAPLLPRF